jgi:hypothetical protein
MKIFYNCTICGNTFDTPGLCCGIKVAEIYKCEECDTEFNHYEEAHECEMLCKHADCSNLEGEDK